IVINVGTAAGVKVGSEYDVLRPGREIKDPATGRVLRRMTTNVGKLKITTADDGSAQGTLSGGPAKVGDCVGACPTSSEAPPPASSPSNDPAPAPSGGAALPALYSAPITEAITWGMYSINGGKHFKYNMAHTEVGRTTNGSYTLDAGKQRGGANVMLTVNGTMGSDSYSSTAAITPGQGIPMMQMMGMGPAAMVLFNPIYALYFGGRQWQLGTGWSQTHNGKTDSFKVESACSYVGVNGLRG